MIVLREFKGICRNEAYTYRVLRVNDELILESYNTSNELIDSITWHDSPINERLILAACNEIQVRL